MRIGGYAVKRPGALVAFGAVAMLGGCSTPSEVVMGKSLLVWTLPLFLLTLATERLHAWIVYRKALRERPRQSWLTMSVFTVGLLAIALTTFSREVSLSTANHLTLGAFMLSGYCFYLGCALGMAGRERDRVVRTLTVIIPTMLVLLPGFFLAAFGSDNPDRGGVLSITAHTILVVPFFIGPPMLFLAFMAALISPYEPVEPIPRARLVRRRR